MPDSGQSRDLHAAVDDTCRISTEIIHSLEAVKHDCLIALDSLLKHILAQTSPTPAAGARRMSDVSMERSPPSCDLLNSIAQNTTRISMISYAKNTSSTMHRSDSSPAIVTMSNVHHMLSSNQQIFLSLADSKDYSLCCALAALLSNVYRIIDFAETSLERCPPPASTQDSNSVNDDDAGRNLYQRLCNRMSIIRYEQMSILSTSCLSSQGLADLWAETDRLMDAVYTLASSSHGTPPPSYHELYDQEDGRKGHVPAYDHTVSTAYNGKTQKDLDTLLSAIDRLGKVAPRLNDQRAEISDRQAGELAAATLGKTVDRLSRGRMEDQRATLASTKLKEDMLYDLMAQIYNLASRTFDNQRVFVGSRLQRKMDEATIFGIMDRSQRGRMTSQDWAAGETSSLREMSRITELLIKSLHRPKFIKQRFQISYKKERDIFMAELYSKVNRMQSRRLENQDAKKGAYCIASTPSYEQEQEDQEQFFQWLQSMQRSRFVDQRASLPTNVACHWSKHDIAARS